MAYLAEIRMTGFNFAPRGWELCNGQLLSVSQYQSLFSLLGTTYGGDGRTTFALPDLRGRTPIHTDHGMHGIGSKGGAETVALTTATIPAHTHTLSVDTDKGSTLDPGGNMLASSANLYHSATSKTTSIQAGTLANSGKSQAHDNMQPSLTVNFIIATQGLFPSRN